MTTITQLKTFDKYLHDVREKRDLVLREQTDRKQRRTYKLAYTHSLTGIGRIIRSQLAMITRKTHRIIKFRFFGSFFSCIKPLDFKKPQSI